jgi:protoporphyrinogen oxidase
LISSQKKSPVCIIGAGLAGLTAALRLAKQKVPVTLIEKEAVPGGLASSIALSNEPIERFYHFICGPDRELLQLIEEVGLKPKLHWHPCKVTYFQNQKLYAFGTPFDLLRFDPVPWSQRIRFGLNILCSTYRKDWRALDKIPARDWLIRQAGPEAYRRIWEPLIKLKFGEYEDQLSAAWIWHRVNRVANSKRKIWGRESHGYLEGGTETLIQRMLEQLESLGAKVYFNTAVEKILTAEGQVTGVKIRTNNSTEELCCGLVYSTIQFPLLADILREPVDNPENTVLKKIQAVKYIGVVAVLLQLDRPFSDSFWMNINVPGIPFNGIIEYTNLNRYFDRGRTHILYIPYYMPVTDDKFSQPDSEYLQECFEAFKMINPRFEEKWVVNSVVSRAAYAQPICDIGFADRVPGLRGPLKGLLVSDPCQLYPADRTLTGAVRLGTEVAKMIISQE